MVYDLGMQFKDLPPKHDPKGGSPRTPVPIPVREFQTKNGFFRSYLFTFLMGQVVTFLVGLIFFAIGWGKLAQQFTEGQQWRVIAEARMERMDSTGTNFARYQVEALRLHAEQNEAKITVLQEETRKIDVMKEKIDRLEGGRKP